MPAPTRVKTALAERLGLNVPIFGFSRSVAVTAAICNAGGLGIYGATRDMREEIVESQTAAEANLARIAAVR